MLPKNNIYADNSVESPLSQKHIEATYFERAQQLLQAMNNASPSTPFVLPIIPAIYDSQQPLNDRSAIVLLDGIANSLIKQFPQRVQTKIKKIYYSNNISFAPWGSLHKNKEFDRDFRVGQLRFTNPDQYEITLPEELNTPSSTVLLEIAKIHTAIIELGIHLMKYESASDMTLYRYDYYPMDLIIQAVTNWNDSMLFPKIQTVLAKEVELLYKSKKISNYMNDAIMIYISNPQMNEPYWGADFLHANEHVLRYRNISKLVELIAIEQQKKLVPINIAEGVHLCRRTFFIH